MPAPEAGETKANYMKRCVPQVMKEGKPQRQAVAICSSMFDHRHQDAPEGEKPTGPNPPP
jgi:hypothetical protein